MKNRTRRSRTCTGLLALLLAAPAASAAPALEEGRRALEAAYEAYGTMYQGSFRHFGSRGEHWEYRGVEGSQSVYGELGFEVARTHRARFQSLLESARTSLGQAEGELETPQDYAEMTRAITDYDTLVDLGSRIHLHRYRDWKRVDQTPMLEGLEPLAFTSPVLGAFSLEAFRELSRRQLELLEDASGTVPLLSCDSDRNSGYHEPSNHFTRILHVKGVDDFYGDPIDHSQLNYADPHEARMIKEVAWEIVEPTLRFKGARNAVRAYLLATQSPLPAPEFRLPSQGPDLLGFRMPDWETMVTWTPVVALLFSGRTDRRDIYMLRVYPDLDEAHLFPEPLGGTRVLETDRDEAGELPRVPLFREGPGGTPEPVAPAGATPGYGDLLGVGPG